MRLCVHASHMLFRTASLLWALCVAPPAGACDIALVLAIDVSGSVDPVEYGIQMQGLAAALSDPAVSEAFVGAQAQVMLMQWTGTGRQAISIPWRSLDSFDAVAGFAGDVATTPRRWRNFSTAIGEAIEVATASFDAPEVAGCDRFVIDVSGDGRSNEGTPPELARLYAQDRRITINAIAIAQTETDLAKYYRDNVIVGQGAFAVGAATFEDYPDRMRQKLLREVVMQIAATE